MQILSVRGALPEHRYAPAPRAEPRPFLGAIGFALTGFALTGVALLVAAS